MWIHEQPNWPHFVWNEAALSTPLAEVRHQQGRLIGRMESLGFELRQEASLTTLTHDVVKSSAIEGEALNPQDVRSSIARRLGLEEGGVPASERNIAGIVDIMIDATQNAQLALTDDRLFDWHRALFSEGQVGLRKIKTGMWRDDAQGPMQVVSGAIGKENLHFQAPSANLVSTEMREFIRAFEGMDTVDPVLKAGILHFWFVTVHPFEDGNGRIGRALADMALTRADGISQRFYSLSMQFEKERASYYNELERQQRGNLNITQWLKWYLECLSHAFTTAEETLNHVLFKHNVWQILEGRSINDRQRLVLNRMLQGNFEGHISTSKYARLAKCSQETASRDMKPLVEIGVFKNNLSKGRSTSYRLLTKEELSNLSTPSS